MEVGWTGFDGGCGWSLVASSGLNSHHTTIRRYAAATPSFVGLYQINFIVPLLPPDCRRA
jgi:hypothetical protein